VAVSTSVPVWCSPGTASRDTSHGRGDARERDAIPFVKWPRAFRQTLLGTTKSGTWTTCPPPAPSLLLSGPPRRSVSCDLAAAGSHRRRGGRYAGTDARAAASRPCLAHRGGARGHGRRAPRDPGRLRAD